MAITADLRGVNLRCRDLLGVDLRKAGLGGADLSWTIYLTQMQADNAWGDAATRLLQDFARPTYWINSRWDSCVWLRPRRRATLVQLRALTYSITVALDGDVDHRGGRPGVDIHSSLRRISRRPTACFSGRSATTRQQFARTIHEIPNYVVATTLESVGSEVELLDVDQRGVELREEGL